MAKIKEGRETYPSKKAMLKHEKAESPARERAEEKAMPKRKKR